MPKLRPGSAPGPAAADLSIGLEALRAQASAPRKRRGSTTARPTTGVQSEEGDPALRPQGIGTRLESWLRRGRRGGIRMIGPVPAPVSEILFSKVQVPARVQNFAFSVPALTTARPSHQRDRWPVPWGWVQRIAGLAGDRGIPNGALAASPSSRFLQRRSPTC